MIDWAAVPVVFLLNVFACSDARHIPASCAAAHVHYGPFVSEAECAAKVREVQHTWAPLPEKQRYAFECTESRIFYGGGR